MITVSNVPHIHIYRSDTKKYSIYITRDMSMLNCTVVWYHGMVHWFHTTVQFNSRQTC